MVYLGRFPDLITVLGIFFDDWQDAGGDYAMSLAEIAINLLQRQRDLLF